VDMNTIMPASTVRRRPGSRIRYRPIASGLNPARRPGRSNGTALRWTFPRLTI
jgi:hypothetical protein